MKICIILPAYNEAPVIGQVLDDLKKEIKKEKLQAEIVVIDDGSIDGTASIVRKKGVPVLSHVLNRGLGGALGTGLNYAKKIDADIAVTLDSDGQHDAKDIKKVIKPILDNQADVVIGTRWKKDRAKMPIDRRIITISSNILTFLLFRIWTTDSQSGFRAFSKEALDVIQIKTQRMEVSSELFGEIKKNKFRLKEAPIRVIYTDYSRKKGQSNLNSIQILLKLMLRLFR